MIGFIIGPEWLKKWHTSEIKFSRYSIYDSKFWILMIQKTIKDFWLSRNVSFAVIKKSTLQAFREIDNHVIMQW